MCTHLPPCLLSTPHTGREPHSDRGGGTEAFETGNGPPQQLEACPGTAQGRPRGEGGPQAQSQRTEEQRWSK